MWHILILSVHIISLVKNNTGHIVTSCHDSVLVVHRSKNLKHDVSSILKT